MVGLIGGPSFWEFAFQLLTVTSGARENNIILQRFPLALYLLWVTCKTTYLGRRFETLRRLDWSMDRWYLELPLSFPVAVVAVDMYHKAYCVDICLGRVRVADIIRDLKDFFQCMVSDNLINKWDF